MSMGRHVEARRFAVMAALLLMVAAALAVWAQARIEAQVSTQLQQHDAQLIGAIHQVAPDALPAVMAAYKTGGTALTAMGQQALRAYGYQALPMALPTQGLLLALALAVALLGCARGAAANGALPGSCARSPGT